MTWYVAAVAILNIGLGYALAVYVAAKLRPRATVTVVPRSSTEDEFSDDDYHHDELDHSGELDHEPEDAEFESATIGS